MSVVALITKSEEIPGVLSWAHEFAVARDANLLVLCWSESLTVIQADRTEIDQDEANKLVAEADSFITSIFSNQESKRPPLPTDRIEVKQLLHPSFTTATVEEINRVDAELLVAAAEDQSGKSGATYASNPLLQQSPCNTVILFGTHLPHKKKSRIIVGITDSAHDVSAVSLGVRMSEKCDAKVTVARAEKDYEEEALEVGRRELRQILRDAGAGRSEKIQREVLSDDIQEITSIMNKNNLVLLGANNQKVVQNLVELTDNPMIAVIKRSPPLKPWQFGRRRRHWIPRLSPADYADLIQNLRSNSKLTIDFMTMLGLAAAIASLGLLQNSPAVVIGSMLLAPLMTPMLGNGLALAQANPKLGRSAMKAIGIGFISTLIISYFIGLFTPGEELTPEIIARGDPNLLDLGIALFSASAAAYALARPNLVGAVAGVAIATALVPPLCSVGIALAYKDLLVAQGATVLFVTNLVAIILGAAATFRLLGVTATKAQIRQRLWVYRTIAVLGVSMFILAIPLEKALDKHIDLGKPQPNTYPLTKAVEHAVREYVNQDPEIEIIATGRPGSIHAKHNVVIVLTSPRPLPRSYADNLRKVIRDAMNNEELKIAIYCVLDAWKEDLDKFNTLEEAGPNDETLERWNKISTALNATDTNTIKDLFIKLSKIPMFEKEYSDVDRLEKEYSRILEYIVERQKNMKATYKQVVNRINETLIESNPKIDESKLPTYKNVKRVYEFYDLDSKALIEGADEQEVDFALFTIYTDEKGIILGWERDIGKMNMKDDKE